MPLPQMHGRTHLPDGSDPIQFAAAMTEYWSGTSTTDWGTSSTILDFTGGGTYDSDTPTFSVNGSSNLEIFKAGLYVLAVVFTGYVNNANVDTVRRLEAKTISGEMPHGFTGNNWATGHSADVLTRLQHVDTGAEDVAVTPWPAYIDFMFFQSDSFDTGTAGPSELQISAFKEEDNSGVAETQVTTRLFVARIGSAWVNP